MSSFVPTNYDLRTALLFCFHLKKTAAESHRMLLEAFGEHALGKTQCFEWFKRFKSGDFDVRNEERGRPPKKFEDADLQALLDEDDAQTQQQLADQLKVTREAISLRLKAMGKIQKVEKQDFIKAQQNIVPASHRVTIIPVKCLPTKIQPLLHDSLCSVLTRLQGICPEEMLTSENVNGQASSRSSSCPRILLCGIDGCHTRHLGPAILHTLEHLPCHVLDVTTLFEETGRAVEETIIQKVKAARHTLPSLLYVPDIMSWWDLVDEAARVVFMSLMRGLDRSVNLLVLTTATSNFTDIPAEITGLYDEHQGEVYEVQSPNVAERQAFFQQLFVKVNSTNFAPNDISNRSSYADFVPIMGPRKIKIENRKQKGNSSQVIDVTGSPEAPESVAPKKIKMETRARSKLSAVPSGTNSGAKTRAALKRENNATGEDSSSPKRQRLSSCVSSSSRALNSDKLTESQIQDLLQRIVSSTDEWSTQQLTSFYASLELTLEKSEDDVYLSMNECLDNFHEYEKNPDNLKRDKP